MSNFADKIKEVELEEAGRKMVLPLPVIARLDGRAFHTFTRGMKRPYDETMSKCMQGLTCSLVRQFHADVGYTQSDEITLVWRKPVLFDGRYQKLTSVLASWAGAVFYAWVQANFPGREDMIPHFDCRVFQVESLERAIHVLAWREYDATKNSVAMAAQSVYSHKELHGKHREQMMDMLHAKGINWNDYPAFFKRGSYFKRVSREVVLSAEELAKIPEKHRPTGPVIRGFVDNLNLEPINSYEHQAIIDKLFPPVEVKEI